MTDPEQTTQVQDQSVGAPEGVASTPPAAQPPVVPASQDAPWSKDLAQRFPDEATRSQVDAYLRDSIQPHITNLEQSSKPAKDLYEAFTSNPDQTLLDVTAELYDDATAKSLADFLAFQAGNTDQNPFEVPTEPQPPAATPQRDPEVQALIDRDKERSDKEAFVSEFQRIEAANPDTKFEFDLFVPFVAKAGDFDRAAEDYKAFASKFSAPAPSDPNEPAPPVLGSEGGSVPPTQKEYANLDEALDDFFQELKATGQTAAPPVTGG